MNKTNIIKMILAFHGYEPTKVDYWKTDGCDGQFEISTGWTIEAKHHENGDEIFIEESCYNFALEALFKYLNESEVSVEFMDDEEFSRFERKKSLIK